MLVAVDPITRALRVLPNAPAIEPPAISSPALTADGVLLVGDHAGKLHAIRTDDGTELWFLPIPGGPLTSSPAIAADGTIYIVGGDGVLNAVSTQ